MLTISDYCTKWVAAIALESKHASGVVIALFKVKSNDNKCLNMFESLLPNAKKFDALQVFMQMGIPRVLTSDQGSEFHNQINEELTTLLKVDHCLSTAYHPQVQKYGGICIELCYSGIKRYILIVDQWFG